ncbi:hypothetical protein L218DRAFT_956952 [Marasmius fiardii PR-910]|nr:hypothetical protein L218DRAFT_956952 [Marasmius fiardii PR-910]
MRFHLTHLTAISVLLCLFSNGALSAPTRSRPNAVHQRELSNRDCKGDAACAGGPGGGHGKHNPHVPGNMKDD